MTAGVVGCDPALFLWPQLDPRLPSVSHLGPPVPPGRSSTGQDGGGGGGGAGLVLSRPSASPRGPVYTLGPPGDSAGEWLCRRSAAPALTRLPARGRHLHPSLSSSSVRIVGAGRGQGGNRPASPSLGLNPRPPALALGGRRHTSLGACEHKGPGLRLGPVGGCVPGVWVGGRLRQLLPCPPQGKVL